jgi:hypothetical protein
MRFEWGNVSDLELWWTTPSVLMFFVTLVMIVWAYQAFAAIRRKVRAEPLRYRAWGPRWNFPLLLLVAMVWFAFAWPIGAFLGVIAMLTPPPVSEVNRTAANWFAWLFIFRDICFAMVQATLWMALRSLSGESILPYGVWKRSRSRY